jgi:vacuolar-type H+-ATPase subunit I/STV1
MIYWTREVAGWLLVALGLASFGVVLGMSLEYRIIPAIPMTVVGVFLFRGGIHLLKVAVAARICQQAQERLYPDPMLGSSPLPGARTQYRASGRA